MYCIIHSSKSIPLYATFQCWQYSTERMNLSAHHEVNTDILRDPRLFAVVLFGPTPSPVNENGATLYTRRRRGTIHFWLPADRVGSGAQYGGWDVGLALFQS